MKSLNLKKAAAVTMVAGGIIAAGAGAASATTGGGSWGPAPHGGAHAGGNWGPAPHGGAHADGQAVNSPGVASGNVVQVPVHVPVNLCGNSISVIGLLNPTFGNTCVNQ